MVQDQAFKVWGVHSTRLTCNLIQASCSRTAAFTQLSWESLVSYGEG